MREILVRAAMALTLIASAATPAAAGSITIVIGTFSYEEFLPSGGPDAPGTNIFKVANYTGSEAIFDTNAATPLIFSSLVLSFPDNPGISSVTLANLSSAPPDPDIPPPSELQFSATTPFISARLDGQIDDGMFFLPDGSLFTADSLSFVAFLPSPELDLGVGDIVAIQITGTTSIPVPETATLLTVSAGIAFLGVAALINGRRFRVES